MTGWLILSPLAHADFKVDYAKGKQAAERGDWAKTRELMQAAQSDNPEPNAKARLTGMRFEPYVPKFYLGLAAFKSGDCSEALRQWQDGATAGIVNSSDALSAEKGQMAAGLRDCQNRVAGGASSNPTSATSSASASATASTTTGTTPTRPPTSVEPNIRPNTPSNTSSTTVASTPSRPLTTPVKPTTTPATTTPPITTPIASTASTASTTAAVSPVLLSALDDYLRGRFDALARAAAESVSDRRVKSHVLLLRAAAKHRLAQRAANGGTWLAQAQADIRSAKALGVGVTPDTQYFSPAFRNLYTNTR